MTADSNGFPTGWTPAQPGWVPVGPQEIAEILGVTTSRVYQLRGRPQFPKPKIHLAYGPLWDRDEILDFASIPRTSGRPLKELANSA